MATLTELANKHGTDKGTTAYAKHGYTVFYEQFLGPIKDQELTFLEIGICDLSFPGASLRMWPEYFTKAKIVGFDLADCSGLMIGLPERVKFYRGDQGNPLHLAGCGRDHGPFRVIIDDGSHKTVHHLTTFYALFKNFLEPGGMYFIEDLHVAPDTVAYFNGRKDLQTHWLMPDKLLMIRRP